MTWDPETLQIEIGFMFAGFMPEHFETIVNGLWLQKQYFDRNWAEHGRWWRKTTTGRAYFKQYAKDRSAILQSIILEIRWCIACKREFEVTAYKIKRKRGLVCSQKCAMQRAHQGKARTLYEMHGVKRPLKDWLVGTEIRLSTAWARLSRGWTLEETLSGKRSAEPGDT